MEDEDRADQKWLRKILIKKSLKAYKLTDVVVLDTEKWKKNSRLYTSIAQGDPVLTGNSYWWSWFIY